MNEVSIPIYTDRDTAKCLRDIADELGISVETLCLSALKAAL